MDWSGVFSILGALPGYSAWRRSESIMMDTLTRWLCAGVDAILEAVKKLKGKSKSPALLPGQRFPIGAEVLAWVLLPRKEGGTIDHWQSARIQGFSPGAGDDGMDLYTVILDVNGKVAHSEFVRACDDDECEC